MFTEIIGVISGFMYSKLLIILLLGAGIYFTFRTGFVQFRLFGESVRVVSEKPDKEGSVSSFQALTTSLALPRRFAWAATALCSGCGSSP